MKQFIRNADAVDVAGDVLIYSTNLQLALTGGVGAALRSRFGLEIQYALNAAADASGLITVKVGDVFETSLPGMPWKYIFHTVATSEQYHTDPAVVRRILRQCLRRSVELGCRRVITSPLGAGFGDLELAVFVRLLEEALEESYVNINEIGVVCRNRAEFETLVKATAGARFPFLIEG